MTESGAAPTAKSTRYLLAVYFIIAVAMVWTFRGVRLGGFQTELDLIRASAAHDIAEWLPHFSETAMMISAPALASSGTLRPGVWIFHVAASLVAGKQPAGQLLFAVFIQMLVAWSITSLAVIVSNDRRAAWAGLIFAVHPVLGDVAATYVNGPALLALLWVTQAGLCYARYVLRGTFGHLVAATMCVFLAISTDDVGIGSLILIAGIEWAMRPRGAALTWFRRTLAIVFCASTGTFFYVVLNMTGVTAGPRVMLSGLTFHAALQAFLYVLKAAALPSLSGRIGNIAAIAAGSAVFLACVYRGLENPRRLMPLLLLPFAVVLFATQTSDPAFPDPSTSLPFLFPTLLVSLVLGDVFTAFKNEKVLYVVLAGLVGYMSTSAALRSEVPVERGRMVRFVGDEIEKIYRDMKDETDIYLIDDGVDRTPLLAGHLDFVYRYGLSHQARFSLVMGGSLAPDEASSLVGQNGQMMRIEKTSSMVFIGWKHEHEGLMVLNDLMDGKLQEARAIMEKEGRFTEPMSIGGQDAVLAWKPRAGKTPIPKDELSDLHWFLEAPILRLHPVVGRRVYGLYQG